MPAHTARPDRPLIHVNGAAVRLTSAQVNVLRHFDPDGVLHDTDPDPLALRVLAHRGWTLRTRGHVVLTPLGRDAKSALDAYLARKACALTPERPT